MREKLYSETKNWMERNARQLDLCLWNYFFEQGEKESVVSALMAYQNEDGGFGNTLEADSWNPDSTPITTQHALDILAQIDFYDMEHPIYQGLWNYLKSEKDLLEYGWRFSIASNDDYPHAPWWTYSEESNKTNYIGVTAGFSAFILRFGDKNARLYQKALEFTDRLLEKLRTENEYGAMGLEGYQELLEAVREQDIRKYDVSALTKLLAEKIKESIEQDTTKWEFYVVRPSNYIQSPDSIFYEENSEIVKKELKYLIDTKPEKDVWGIPWTWFDNMDKYGKEFAISENWWKGYRAVCNMRLLKNFADRGIL